MRDLGEDELAKLESDAPAQQLELEAVVADPKADRRVVASDLKTPKELWLRLEAVMIDLHSPSNVDTGVTASISEGAGSSRAMSGGR